MSDKDSLVSQERRPRLVSNLVAEPNPCLSLPEVPRPIADWSGSGPQGARTYGLDTPVRSATQAPVMGSAQLILWLSQRCPQFQFS